MPFIFKIIIIINDNYFTICEIIPPYKYINYLKKLKFLFDSNLIFIYK